MDIIKSGNIYTNVKGIVVKEMRFSESGKIIKLFTRDMGLISVMAKGALNIKSPFRTLCMLYSEINIKLFKGKNFFILCEGENVNFNYNLQNNLVALSFGNLVLEIFNKAVLEGIKNIKAYNLLSSYINCLNKDVNQMILVISFLLKFNSFMGYTPLLILSDEDSFNLGFSHEEGGIVSKDKFICDFLLTKGEAVFLKNCLYLNFENCLKQNIQNVNIKKLLNLSIEFSKYNFEINYLNSIKPLRLLKLL